MSLRLPAVRTLVVTIALGGLATVLRAQASAPDCTGAPAADTLVRAHSSDATASAYWLTGTTIRWPAAPDTGQYALYRAVGASIQVTIGEPVRGADSRLALMHDKAPLAPALADRFRFVAPGATLRPGTTARGTLDSLMREQLVLVREDASQRVLAATHLQAAGALDDLYADAERATDLGVTLHRGQAHLAVWAPTARTVAVCVAPVGGRAGLVRMTREARTGIWRATMRGSPRLAQYRYVVDVIVPGVGLVRNRVTDPYSVALTSGSTHSVMLSLDDPATIPSGWARAPRPAPAAAATDQVIYELHIRDFSASDSTVPPALRGRYLAFAQPNSAGIRHLTALRAAGLTDVHLLPAYDLASVPETGCVTPAIPRAAPESDAQQAAVSAVRERDCFNWGYDPWHYTVPEGSYATDAANAATRIREFRAMVMALHARGLRVGMDVVYNHTFAAGQAATSVLDRIVPGYYHRRSATGSIERSTCCENTATEHAMMAKLMIESAATWVRHYRIDAFRFDLMGHQPRRAMLALQRAVDSVGDRHIPLLGEGWNFGEVADGARFVQASQRSLAGDGIATFSDRARDALRGGGCCDSKEGLVANQGLLNGLVDAPNAMNAGRDRRAELRRAHELVRIGLAGTLRDYTLTGSDGVARAAARFDYAGQPAGYAAAPADVVNYVENHDNLTLFDLNAFRLPSGTSREDRARAQLLGIAVTLFSQGVPYLHAGVDILRSKSLDRDSFDSGDWFNRLDWTYRENGFGAGVPPAHRNRDDWPQMQTVLRDTTIAPTPAEIAFTRDGTRALLAIRASSSLFRLRSSAEVQQRLRFLAAGPTDDPAVIIGHLSGEGYAGAGAREVVYFLNFAATARSIALPSEREKRWALHPAHRAAARAVAGAAYTPATGTFLVPGRTAVVFIVPDTTR